MPACPRESELWDGMTVELISIEILPALEPMYIPFADSINMRDGFQVTTSIAEGADLIWRESF